MYIYIYIYIYIHILISKPPGFNYKRALPIQGSISCELQQYRKLTHI